MQKRMHHSKCKNTGILFELLTRQITADILAGKQESGAKELLFKYFKENTELSKEWKLYNAIICNKLKDVAKADRFLNIILEERKKLNFKKLTQEKYLLIKEIKHNYPLEDLLKAPIRHYKTLASIYKIFENLSSSNAKFSVEEIFKAKSCLVEHITDKPTLPKKEIDDDLIKCYKQQSKETRLLAYELLVEKLNTKYKTLLDEDQKLIIREYIYNVANTNSLGEFVKNQLSKIKTLLMQLTPQISDRVTKIKICEVTNQLEKMAPTKTVKDNQIVVLLLSHELLKECKKQLNIT